MFDVAFADRAAFLPAAGTLVVADLHVGRADAAGVEVPLPERDDLTTRLSSAIERFSPTRVVVAGDVLHEFGRVSQHATGTLAALRDVCADADAEFVLVAGNHDAMLSTAWDGDCHDAYALADGDVVVCHGHETPSTETETEPALYVIGHDHPAITIEGQKRPCFLYGEGVYGGSDLLVLPAFSKVASGVSVNRLRGQDFQSPLVSDVDALRPVVWDEGQKEALTFPPLGEFRRML